MHLSTFLKQKLRLKISAILLQYSTIEGAIFFISMGKTSTKVEGQEISKANYLVLNSSEKEKQKKYMQHFSLGTRTEGFLFVFWKN